MNCISWFFSSKLCTAETQSRTLQTQRAAGMRCRGSSTCSTHARVSWAPPQAVQAKRGFQQGLLNQPWPGTNFCHCPSQLGPADRLTLYIKPAPKHPFLPLYKAGRHGEEVNSSTLFAPIHAKSFSLCFEKEVYIWSHCMKDKICCFQLCHCMLYRKAWTLAKSHSKALSASEFFVCSLGFSCLTVTGSGKNFLWLIRF